MSDQRSTVRPRLLSGRKQPSYQMMPATGIRILSEPLTDPSRPKLEPVTDPWYAAKMPWWWRPDSNDVSESIRKYLVDHPGLVLERVDPSNVPDQVLAGAVPASRSRACKWTVSTVGNRFHLYLEWVQRNRHHPDKNAIVPAVEENRAVVQEAPTDTYYEYRVEGHRGHYDGAALVVNNVEYAYSEHFYSALKPGWGDFKELIGELDFLNGNFCYGRWKDTDMVSSVPGDYFHFKFVGHTFEEATQSGCEQFCSVGDLRASVDRRLATCPVFDPNRPPPVTADPPPTPATCLQPPESTHPQPHSIVI
jgi:hypothetical protein